MLLSEDFSAGDLAGPYGMGSSAHKVAAQKCFKATYEAKKVDKPVVSKTDSADGP